MRIYIDTSMVGGGLTNALKIFLALTTTLVVLSIGAALLMRSTMYDSSGLGTLGVIIFMIVALPTIVLCLVTCGLCIFQRNRQESNNPTVLRCVPKTHEMADRRDEYDA